jgi:RND family efflux transporter MFP subunit
MKNSQPSPLAAVLVAASIVLAACGGGDKAPPVRRTPITAAKAETRNVEAVETTVGRLEASAEPDVSAETAGRVMRIVADGGKRVKKGEVLAYLDDEVQRLAVTSARSNVERLQALLSNQQRTVKRYTELQTKAVSQSMLEEAVSAQTAREAELRDAQARLADAEYRLARTRIVSPVDAVIQRRLISEGDYVNVGTPLFAIIGQGMQRAILPFPERLAHELVRGLRLTLEQPANPGTKVEATITDVRPMVGTNNRAVEALADPPAGTNWPAGGSITARVVIASRKGVVVPPGAIVRRPVGDVVYVITDGKAAERKVLVGVRSVQYVEVLTGIKAGETVAVLGAPYLSDGALVDIKQQG